MHSEKYQQYEADNQIPYHAFLEYLNMIQDVGQLDKSHIMTRIQDLMIDCH